MFKILLFILIFINIIVKGRCNSVKISIIMPVFNTEKYLNKSIQSVLNQTIKDIELICIDDASTDNSLMILMNMKKKDNRIKIIHNDKNQGPSISRNKGIELASGEFLGFMDDDDYVDLKFFETLYNYSNDYDIVTGIYVLSTNYSFKYIHYIPYFSNIYYKGNIVDSIFRRSFINEHNIKFPNKIRIGEDIKFRQECLKNNPKIFDTPDEGIYYYYKQRKDSAMKYGNEYINNLSRNIKLNSKNKKRNLKKMKKELKKKEKKIKI